MQLAMQPNIGLDDNARQSIVEILNIILADVAVVAIKTRSAHWNVRGSGFFELHNLFDIQYKQLDNISDEIAERAQMLGGFAIASFPDFSNHTRLEEQPGVIPDLLHLLADHEAVIRYLRGDAARCAEEYEDEGTFDLLVSVIRLHEKMAWTLRSYTQ
jgi:starvation-inducible DNA-binding protein